MQGKTLNKEQQDVVGSKPGVVYEENSSIKDKERYLCIYDGYSIYCLDLNQTQDESNCIDPPPLPKLSTLNLPEKGLPILAGLFKLGSNAYLIGGRKFSTLEKDGPHDWFMDIFDSLAELNGLNGTSRVTYSLSLDNGTLSLSKCDYIKPLKKPICWPVVEKIGNELHVMEFFPKDLFDCHEMKKVYHVAMDVNNLGGGWQEIQQMVFEIISNSYSARMYAHIVVGDRIYSKAEIHMGGGILVFDAKEYEWMEKERWSNLFDQNRTCKDPFLMDHVSDLLEFGRGRCVGGFLRGQFRDSLFVVFGIVVNRGHVHAVAYLVTFDGHVICTQRVSGFFGKSVGPASVIECTVIDVDDEEEEEEKKMCAVVRGKMGNDGESSSEGLFVYVFTVEEVSDARMWVGDVWRRASEKTGKNDVWSCEKDFVRVVVKKRYAYKMDGDCKEGDGVSITRLQPCFL